MDLQLYQQFVTLKAQRKKSEAKDALTDFIASFQSFEEKQQWVHAFLESQPLAQAHKIRHELYEQLVFPVLREGYERKEAWAIRWLAKTVQNLYAVPALHAIIGRKSELQLLKEAYALEPLAEIRGDLLQVELRWFAYCQHEWPLGILYGTNQATRGELEDILREIEFTKTLDKAAAHAVFLADFEQKVRSCLH